MGTTRIDVPCVPLGEGGTCPAVPLTVCVTPTGVSNTGVSCSARPDANDCCGANKICGTNEVCVLKACSGESCLPTATCQPVTSNLPPTDACGACPNGTICAPVPCQAATCPPKFACVASNVGSSASCEPTPECSCPGGICNDCAVGSYCNAAQKCVSLCADDVTTNDCCTNGALRPTMQACCPSGEVYNPDTKACDLGGYSCNCPADSFCDPYSGRCILRGG